VVKNLSAQTKPNPTKDQNQYRYQTSIQARKKTAFNLLKLKGICKELSD
jgi:hypothetical protein